MALALADGPKPPLAADGRVMQTGVVRQWKRRLQCGFLVPDAWSAQALGMTPEEAKVGLRAEVGDILSSPVVAGAAEQHGEPRPTRQCAQAGHMLSRN